MSHHTRRGAIGEAPGAVAALAGALALILLAGAALGAEAPPDQEPASRKNSLGMEFVRVPAGEFTMGSTTDDKDSRPDERPAHKVRITRSFLIAKHEVTVGQFRGFVEATGYKTDAERNGGPFCYLFGDKWEKRPDASWRNPGFAQTDQHPVVCVSWNDAQKFIAWLNASDKARPETLAYRLPTEAEWEYAARGADRRIFPWGKEWGPKRTNFADKRSELPWSAADADDAFARTAPVGSYSPAGDTPLGLADLGGNVWEWCEDWYEKDFYKTSPVNDPANTTPGKERVERGGSWAFTADRCRTAFRFKLDPAASYDNLGFRVVLAAGHRAARPKE